MGRHQKRRKQADIPTSDLIHKAPTFRTTTTKTRKRVSDTRHTPEYLMNALNNTMERRLASRINVAINSNKELDSLKDELLAARSLPVGVVSEAEEDNDILPTTITNHLRQKVKGTNVTLWIDLVNKRFGKIAEDIKKGDKSLLSSSDALQESSSSASGSSTSGSPSGGSREKAKVLKKDENIRSCTTSMNSILRQNNEHDKVLKAHFIQKINEAISQVSDYASQFGLLVLSLITVLKHHSFMVNQSGSLELHPYEGLEISKFFPDAFNIEKDTFAPPPISSNTILGHTDGKFQKDFESLFTQNSFQNIHSHFFGEKGLTNATKTGHPLITLFLNFIPKNRQFPFKSEAVPAVMMSSLTSYITNFSNMWSKNRIFKKSLDNILKVLINIHLAPDSHEARQQYINNLKDKKKDKDVKRKQRNIQRNTIRNKQHNMLKCEQKAEHCDDPQRKARYLGLAKYYKLTKDEYEIKYKKLREEKEKQKEKEKERPENKQVPKNNGAEKQNYKYTQDGEEVIKSGDISRRRQKSLAAVIKKLLYQRKERYTRYNFKEQMPDITDKEVEVCLKLANYIGPYIPDRKQMLAVIYQLPLVLLANDILHMAGYSTKTAQICPLPSLCHLDALTLNAEMIFDIFCSDKTKPLDIYGADGDPINSKQATLSQKHYMFDGFFEMDVIGTICGRYSLKFIHEMHILPGIKTVRLTGVKTNPDAIQRATMMEDKAYSVDPRVVIEESTSKEELQRRLKILDTEISALERQLTKTYEERNQQGISTKIKEEKRKWTKPNTEKNRHINDEIMTNLKSLKTAQQKQFVKIQEIKSTLAAARTNRWIKQRALNNKIVGVKNKTPAKAPKKLVTRNNPTLLEKAEKVILSNNTSQYVFSGTDNGLKAMTTTVAVPHSLYMYHEKLHNPAHSKSTINFRPLPRPNVIRSNDVDVGTGAAYMRRWRLQRKRRTKQGVEVQKAEQALYETASLSVETFSDVFTIFNRQRDISKTVQDFYYSRPFLNKKRTTELSADRFKDRLASKERQFITSSDKTAKKLPVMMIGDRGTGVGSKIKGFNRYGGKWLTKRHGRYLAACVTNEHNSSQICVYCFHKIIHPKRMIKNADGQTKNIDSNGSSVCINPECVSFKAGKAVQSRDVQSALAICLAGVSTLINGRPFKELDPKNSHYNTVNQNKEPFSSGTEAIVGQSRQRAGIIQPEVIHLICEKT